MRTFIPSMMIALTALAGSYAQADNDPCEALREQYNQLCVNPQVTNKQGIAIMAAACTVEAITIAQCENQSGSQSGSQYSGSGGDDSDDDN